MARDRTGEPVEQASEPAEVVTGPNPSMLERINRGADLSPDEAHESIVRRVMAAESVSEVLAEQQVTHSRDILDVPFMLESVHFNESTIDGEGPGFYGILNGTRMDTNEKVTVSCGGRTVLAQLYKLQVLADGLPNGPVAIRLRQADKPSKRGYFPLWLRAA